MKVSTPIAELEHVSKRFGGTQALDEVSLVIGPNEVHALVGENGAGKSTLGKIIAGVYIADTGILRISGKAVTHWDSVRAQKRGVVMIAQELSLVPDLTVAQNVFLGIEDGVFGILRRNIVHRFEEIESLAQFGLNPGSIVRDLRIADLQKVEIMRALARDAQLIVMDEPTSSLTAHETVKLHGLIAHLREQGRSVVYVSHFLDAVLDVSDRVTIMRDGRLIRTGDVKGETKRSMINGMLGRELAVSFPERAPSPEPGLEPILHLESVSSQEGVHDVSLDVRPGEIVGLLGLVGSGRTEIARVIVGADKKTGGHIIFNGHDLGEPSLRSTIDRGIVLVPEDRHRQGLILERSVRENISLAFLRYFSRFGIVRDGIEKARVLDVARQFEVRPLRMALPMRGLSGGNQQKALLAKWLVGSPSFVILDEPTRGVDIGAKLAIYNIVVELALKGVGVLLISSEHEEVLSLAHRAYLVSRGRVIGEIDPPATTVETVLERLFSVGDADHLGKTA